MIELARVLPEEAGFDFIPYSSSIKVFLNSWLRNFPPWSYVTSIRQVYLANHTFYTKFAIVITF